MFRAALLLLNDHPETITTFLFISMFSMAPLCIQDNLIQIYPLFVAYYLILLVKFVSNESLFSKAFHTTNILLTSTMVLALLTVKPPVRYPYLLTLLVAEYSFLIFALTFAYIYYKNIESNWSTFFSNKSMKKKKTN